MKVGDLIKVLKDYKDFDIALAFKEPSSTTFHDIITIRNAVIYEITYSDKKVMLAPRNLVEN